MPDRDVEFEIGATDRSGPATKSAADGFEKMGRSADRAADKIDEVGDQAGQTARKLLEARAAAAALAREFDKTGNSKILKDFEKINREAAKLGRVNKQLSFKPEIKDADGFLGKVAGFAKEAGLISSKAAIQGFGDLFSALPTEIKGGIIAGGVAGAAILGPLMVGMLEGTVLAGVGAGVIGLTALIASQNEKVKQQYGILGDYVMTKLKTAAEPMTTRLLDAVPQLTKAFDREMPIISRIMAQAATDFGPILSGTINAIHAILPSLERAAKSGGMVLAGIFSKLPMFTAAVGGLLDAFSDGAGGASASLQALLVTLTATVRVMEFMARTTVPALDALGAGLEFIGASDAPHQLTTLATESERAAHAAQIAGQSYEDLAQSLGNTANMARQVQSNFDALFATTMNVDQANLALKQGVLDLTESVKQNGTTLDQNTQKGVNNVGMIQQQIQNLDKKRQADIAAGNGTVEATNQANAAYASNVASLRALLINLGFAASAVDALIGKYAAIPKQISTTITTVFRTIGSPGQSDQATGHSRAGGGSDLSGLSSWAPAAFAAAERGAFAAMGGRAPYQPPMQITSTHQFEVLLDGAPFRSVAVRSARAADERQAWRNYVGPR